MCSSADLVARHSLYRMLLITFGCCSSSPVLLEIARTLADNIDLVTLTNYALCLLPGDFTP